MQSQMRYRPNTAQSTIYTTGYSYDGSGHLLSAQINDGRRRTVTYTSDLSGQVIRRDEADTNYSAGDPHEIWYRFGGKEVGYVGNNGTLDTDYQTPIDNRGRTSGTGAFRFGASYGGARAEFDLSAGPITSYEQGGHGGSYTVQAGERLGSIAQNLWGDASLWYKRGEANGLAAASRSAKASASPIPPASRRTRTMRRR